MVEKMVVLARDERVRLVARKVAGVVCVEAGRLLERAGEKMLMT